MKKFGVVLFCLFAVSVALAQDSVKIQKPFFSRMAEKGILNHMDVGVNVGSLGIGVDVAVPVGNYVRLRAGYNYMPAIKIHSNFNSIETREGSIKNYINKIDDIDAKFAKYGIDINDPKFATYKEMLDNFRSMEKKDYVTMSLKPNLHQFKFLVDVMPFKHNKHWSFTAGFFVGPSDVGYADNVMEGVNALDDIDNLWGGDSIDVKNPEDTAAVQWSQKRPVLQEWHGSLQAWQVRRRLYCHDGSLGRQQCAGSDGGEQVPSLPWLRL